MPAGSAGERLDFRCLGPLEVRRGATTLPISGARLRTLLAIFLSRANQAISTDELAEQLWQGELPASAATALRVHVTHLRRALEPHRPHASPSVRLPASPPGYRLRVDADEVDAERFERLVVTGRQQAAAGEARGAVSAFEEAIGTWSGPAYADVRDLECIRGEIVRLEKLNLAALEELAEARLALGEPSLAAALMEKAVGEDPLREAFTRLLMLALYRSGRQAEALRVYARLRAHLSEELGVDPAPELQDLERGILLQDPDLAWVPSEAETSPVEVRPAPGGLVGREGELARLDNAWAAMAAGGPRLVLVTGEAGIGKTTLVDAFAGRRRAAGNPVLWGRCDPQPVASYQPFVEAFEGWAPDLELLGGPPSGVDAGPSDPAAERYQLFEAVAEALAAVGADGPVLLVVEDLHWADRPTMLLLRHLARHQRITNVLLLATAREQELSAGSELGEAVARLQVETGGEPIQLSGLDDEHVQAVLHTHAPGSMLSQLEPLAPVVREATRGNPFLVKELIQSLIDHQQVVDANVVLSLAPPGVRELVRHRIAGLSRPASAAARVAAVIGHEFTLDVLAAATDLDDETVLPVVEEMLAVGLFRESESEFDRFEFAHPVVRNVIYDGLTRSRRTRTHRTVGEAIESLSTTNRDDRAGELAHHFFEAVPTGVASKACSYGLRAGNQALERLAYEDAVTRYEQVLGLTDEGQLDELTVARSTLRLGEALEGAGLLDEARDAYARAARLGHSLGDAQLMADAAIAFGGPWASTDDRNRALLPLLDEALTRSVTSDGPVERLQQVELLARKAAALYYVDPVEEEKLAGDALALARASGDPHAVLAALDARHRLLTHSPEHTEKRLALAGEMIGVAGVASAGEELLRGRRHLLYDLLEVGAFTEFHRELDVYTAEADEHRRPAHVWWAAALRSANDLLQGDLDAADRSIEAAFSQGQELQQPDALGTKILQQFVARYQRGALDQMRAMLEPPPTGDAEFSSVHTVMMATVAAENGRHDDVLALIQRLRGRSYSALRRDVFWTFSVAMLLGAACRVGATEAAGELAAMLRPHRGRAVVAGVGGAVLGLVDHWLGVHAAMEQRWIDACGLFEGAADRCRAGGAGYWAAQAEADLVGALLERDSERARNLADKTLTLARQSGWGRIAANCQAARPDGWEESGDG